MEDEQELEAGVLAVFREYGMVFVKIRRDAKNMPFAFCQYAVSLIVCKVWNDAC
jgi:hypothetical protein